MNHIYRSIWNEKTGTFVAVSETTRNGGKNASAGGSVAVGSGFALKALAVSLLMAFGANLYALPVNGVVAAGEAGISSGAGSMTVNQSSQNAALNWQSFNIGQGETVRFVQPNSSAVALNRVLGADPSSILGNLSANGKVFLVNPNGILFGKGASVNVGGLVASTLNISDSDFMAGRYKFAGTGGTILNQGSINADGGYVALLGANVSNQGTIAAKLGTVALAAGNAITLDVAGDGLINVSIDQGAVNALVDNGGMLQADGGHVLLSAQAAGDLLLTAVNNTGVIQAHTIDNRSGTIRLLGDMQSGTVNVGGTLDASAPTGGNGGFIDTSAAQVRFASGTKVTTTAANGLTGSWLIDPTDYNIAASGGDISGADLSTALGMTNVDILSSGGFGGTSGNINVDDTVTWSANKLTLNAQNNININTMMNGSGTASLALQYGQASVAAGNTSAVNIRAAINLPAGDNFSTTLGSDGVTKNYTVITSLGAAGSTTGTDLQGMNGNLARNYALGSNIDASATSGWNGGAGFDRVGKFTSYNDWPNQYVGTFDGLGHDISNLTINRPTTNYVAMFGSLGSTGAIKNVGLVNAAVTGQAIVGTLVGFNFGPVSNSYATGAVNGRSSGVGGLVGYNSHGTVTNSYASVAVNFTSAAYNETFGGLVGYNYGGKIRDSYATGTVRGGMAGGLVGLNNNGTIERSYATGLVTGTNNAGGLVGGQVRDLNVVTSSYWNTSTTGQSGSAGGTGLTTAQMQQKGNFVGWDFVNNWVAYDTFTNPMLRAFMTPLTVTVSNAAKTYDGAVYGGVINATYSSTPDSNLLGSLRYGNNALDGINAGSHSASGLYSTNQQGGYAIAYVGGTLVVDRASLTVSTSSVSKTYDGTLVAAGTATVTSGTLYSNAGNGGAVDSISGGSFVFTDANAGNGNKTVSASSVTVTDGNSGGNYNITYVDNTTSTIAAKVLTASASAASKTYDGNTTATATLTLNGLVGAETINTTSTATFNSKDVSTANLVTVNSILLADGTGLARNYTLASGQTAAATIAAKALNVSGITAANKVYDGNTAATLSGGTLTGLIGAETLTLTGQTGTFSDKNVGVGKAVTVTGTALANGTGLASNYSIANPSGLSADITRLSTVSWVGGTTGNWFDAANWAGGAVPDLANVANVVIPAGVAVSFNSGNTVLPAQAGAVNVDTIGSDGSLRVVEGSLSVAASVQLTSLEQSGGTLASNTIKVGSFTQSGGALISSGNLTVSSAYSQSSSGASVNVGGNIGIAQTSGSTMLGNISTAGTLGVSAVNGNITQLAGTSIASTGAVTLSAPNGNVTLANSGNRLGTVIVSDTNGLAVSSGGANGARLQNALASTASVDGMNTPEGNAGESSSATGQSLRRSPSGSSVGAILDGLNVTLVGQGVKLPPGVQPDVVKDDEK